MMIKGKIYFRKNSDGSVAASINLTGEDVNKIRMMQKEQLFVQVDETGRTITMKPMDDIKI